MTSSVLALNWCQRDPPANLLGLTPPLFHRCAVQNSSNDPNSLVYLGLLAPPVAIGRQNSGIATTLKNPELAFNVLQLYGQGFLAF